MLEQLPVAAFILDDQGCILQANERAQERLQCSFRRLQGQALSDWLRPKQAVEKALQQSQYQQDLVTHDLLLLDKEPCSLHLAMQAGQYTGLLISALERQDIDQQVQQRRMAEAVARIALEMAHEVKNPLAALRATGQWLEGHATQAEEQEALGRILSDVDRIRERIDTFLQLGPRANLAMQSVNIHHLLDDVSAMCPAEIRLKRCYDPSLPEVWLHASRFRQALENIWHNALEAEPIYIEWQTRMSSEPHVFGKNRQGIELILRNDGHAVPEHMRSHVFEPYVSAKARGSGLGLAIVQRVMLEHHGYVQLHAQKDYTEVILKLPLTVDKALQ